MRQTVFSVPKMDRADGDPSEIEAGLAPLGPGTAAIETTDAAESVIPVEVDPVRERRTLKIRASAASVL